MGGGHENHMTRPVERDATKGERSSSAGPTMPPQRDMGMSTRVSQKQAQGDADSPSM